MAKRKAQTIDPAREKRAREIAEAAGLTSPKTAALMSHADMLTGSRVDVVLGDRKPEPLVTRREYLDLLDSVRDAEAWKGSAEPSDRAWYTERAKNCKAALKKIRALGFVKVRRG